MQSRKNAKSTNSNKKQPPQKGMRRGTPPAKAKTKSNGDGSRNRNLQGSVAAAYSTGNSGKAPKVTATNDSCRVVHRELLGNVSGAASAAFTVSSTFALNPGISATFPWLSNIAQNWETYHFSKLRFCYYTRTGSNTAGSVIMAPDYDAADAAPATEQTVSSYEDIQEDAPWKDICCTLRVPAMHPMGSKKFIRTGALAVNQDIKMYDVGNFYVCVVDSGGAVPWGKVWVEYDVTFHTPQLSAGGSSFSSVGLLYNGTGTSAANLFGTVANQSIQGGLSISGAANVLTISNATIGAEYLLDSIITGSVITVFNDGGALAGATVKVNLFDGFNAAATGGVVTTTYLATASTITITFNCTATTVTSMRVAVMNVPSGDANF